MPANWLGRLCGGCTGGGGRCSTAAAPLQCRCRLSLQALFLCRFAGARQLQFQVRAGAPRAAGCMPVVTSADPSPHPRLHARPLAAAPPARHTGVWVGSPWRLHHHLAHPPASRRRCRSSTALMTSPGRYSGGRTARCIPLLAAVSLLPHFRCCHRCRCRPRHWLHRGAAVVPPPPQLPSMTPPPLLLRVLLPLSSMLLPLCLPVPGAAAAAAPASVPSTCFCTAGAGLLCWMPPRVDATEGPLRPPTVPQAQ